MLTKDPMPNDRVYRFIMIEIDLDIGDWDKQVNWHMLCEKSIYSIIENSSYSDITHSSYKFSISITLSSNDHVCTLNKQYRGKDKPTNILSFPMIEPKILENINAINTPESLLGDLVLSHEICKEEAKDKEIAIEAHFQHLIAHGMLHLLGYDHIEDEDAEIMQNIEINALNEINIDNPYEKG